MWLPINGEPPPTGGAPAGGGQFALKKANVSRAVMRARVTKGDSKAAETVAKNKSRVKEQRSAQRQAVGEFRVDTRELSALLKETGASVDAVQAVEQKVGHRWGCGSGPAAVVACVCMPSLCGVLRAEPA